MKIEKYLTKHKISQIEFARLVNVTKGAMSRYVNGTRKPRPALALAIVKLTKGEVTLEDLYK